jgi:hypothetical protein
MEFDHVTNRYLYPDRYMKMTPYFLNAGTIEKLSCVHLGTHARCGGTDTAIVHALQGDGRISRA